LAPPDRLRLHQFDQLSSQRVMSHALRSSMRMTHGMRIALLQVEGPCVLFKNSAICFDAQT